MARVKSYRKKDGTKVKTHIRRTAKTATGAIPGLFDDKAVQEVWDIYEELEKMGKQASPDSKRMVELYKKLQKYPEDLRYYVTEIY